MVIPMGSGTILTILIQIFIPLDPNRLRFEYQELKFLIRAKELLNLWVMRITVECLCSFSRFHWRWFMLVFIDRWELSRWTFWQGRFFTVLWVFSITFVAQSLWWFFKQSLRHWCKACQWQAACWMDWLDGKLLRNWTW